MKKMYLSLILAASSAYCLAQPVVQANLPANGSSFYMYTSSSQLGHTLPGASQTWNFSTANKSLLLTQKWVAVNGLAQVIQDSFPGATHAIEQSLGSGVASTEMHKLTGDRFLHLGAKNSGNSWTQYNPPNIRFRFPMNIGDTAMGGSNSIILYDASGTLTTPFGTYTNVVRLRRKDAATADTLFYFYQFSPSYLLLCHYVVNASTGNTQNAFFYEPVMPTGITEFSKVSLEIYPNPVKSGEKLHFKNPFAGEAQVSITDLTGKRIHSFRIAAGQEELSLDLKAGLYLLSAEMAGTRATYKICVR